MRDEARASSGLDPARGAPWRRPRGRRWPRFSAERAYRGPTYAALDLGTNNCRLLIARPSDEGFTVIDAFSRVVRLGEGLATSGKISVASTPGEGTTFTITLPVAVTPAGGVAVASREAPTVPAAAEEGAPSRGRASSLSPAQSWKKIRSPSHRSSR